MWDYIGHVVFVVLSLGRNFPITLVYVDFINNVTRKNKISPPLHYLKYLTVVIFWIDGVISFYFLGVGGNKGNI
uniref:Putative ovule protein n=1 Tax=Solanum chacoense TaxID=4108 RepID=A0A0V0HX63_SOLCH